MAPAWALPHAVLYARRLRVKLMQARKNRANASLKTKVMLVLGAVVGILLLGNGAIFGFVFWPAFIALERTAAQKNVDRVVDGVQKEQEDLERVSRDWSAWDPTYEYAVAPNEDYERQSFTFDVMHDLNLSLIAIYDIDGNRVKAQAYNLQSGEQIDVAQFGAAFAPDDPFLPHVTGGQTSGILMTEHGPMLLAGFPIVQSTREGPFRGSLFMGRLVDDEMVASLVAQTHVQFAVFQTDPDKLPPLQAPKLAQLAPGEDNV